MPIRLQIVAKSAAIFLASALFAHAAPPPNMVHVRGTVQSFKGTTLIVATADGPMSVQLPAKVKIAAVLPSSRSRIKDGSFLGIASTAGPGGAQVAREVVVFPEAARGTGEGSYPWDLPGGAPGHSKMTNGTVHSTMTNGAARSKMTNGTVHGASGGAVTLQYKSGSGVGSQQIALPPGIPVVTFGPGSPALLTPAAHVFVAGHKLPSGEIVADRVLAGKNGVVPPM